MNYQSRYWANRLLIVLCLVWPLSAITSAQAETQSRLDLPMALERTLLLSPRLQ